MQMAKSARAAAIIVAATIGGGFFALPYVFQQSGWLAGLAYLTILAAIIIVAHSLYLGVLQREGEKERLLGLVKKYFGETGFWIGFIAIIGGLMLSLIAFLILGPRFILLAVPTLPSNFAFALFWLIIAIPVLVSNRRAAALEVLGAIMIAGVILFVFANGITNFSFAALPAIATQPANLFLPFGIVLLMLAGWTGIEPVYETTGEAKVGLRGVILGTTAVAVLYLLFVIGIFGGAPAITADTLSGIVGWALWKRLLIAALGLFAIGTGSVPLSHEIRNAFEDDLGWNPIIARLVIIFLPPAVILAGFNNFISVLSLSGGVFVALQYVLILLVGRRALPLSRSKKTAIDIAAGVFILGAIYQIIVFVVK
jgi:amino acid permease